MSAFRESRSGMKKMSSISKPAVIAGERRGADMVIRKEENEKKLVVKLEGSIDSNTAPQFSEALGSLEGIEELVLDFKGVDYTASAGIRVILTAYKRLLHRGSMKLTNVNDTVYSALMITGIIDKLTIERC